MRHQLFFVVVPQHAHERRIGFEDLAFQGAEINAFLEGLEELGEAKLGLALSGDVAGHAADRNDFVAFQNRLQDGVEIAGVRRSCEFWL